MTRQEEIAEKAREMYHAGAQNALQFRVGFCTGAKWADEHPREGLWDAEKVIEWLKEYTDDYIVCDSDDSWLRVADFIRDLRKAMEE